MTLILVDFGLASHHNNNKLTKNNTQRNCRMVRNASLLGFEISNNVSKLHYFATTTTTQRLS